MNNRFSSTFPDRFMQTPAQHFQIAEYARFDPIVFFGLRVDQLYFIEGLNLLSKAALHSVDCSPAFRRYPETFVLPPINNLAFSDFYRQTNVPQMSFLLSTVIPQGE
jgi:hypothetical protein